VTIAGQQDRLAVEVAVKTDGRIKTLPFTIQTSDCDGMYVTVSPTDTVTFRYDYRLNGCRETRTIGSYGPAGISLALARETLIDVKRAVAKGNPRHWRSSATSVG